MTRWDEVLGLAERELAMLRDGDAEGLPEAMARRDRLAQELGPAPASARPVLERLAAVQEQLICELTLGRDEVARELVALRRGRGAVRGYQSTSSAPTPAGAVERSA